jgi:tyramine---L-glutamate ligase
MAGISSNTGRPMRVFVYEYVTGGGLQGKPLGSRLVREGRQMADQLVQDITAVPGVEVHVARDPRIPHEFPAGVRVMRDDLHTVWGRGLAEADATWLVAPESGGVLAHLTRTAEASASRLLCCTADAVELASSKWQTMRRLEGCGVPVVPTVRPGEALPPHDGAWVVKPDDGVGCEGVRIIPSREHLGRWMLSVDTSGWIVQPFLGGEALSLSLLCLEGEADLLAVNRQIVKACHGSLWFEGCDVNVPTGPKRAVLADMADRVAAAMPGLRGIVGIDLLWTARGPCLLEVNPRLTTSYAGLHEALGVNPAAMVLHLGNGVPRLPASSSRTVAVRVQDESEVSSHG